MSGVQIRKHVVTTAVNGNQVEFLCEPRQSLLEVLRDVLGLTGAKEGCNNGNCGACTVLLDGQPVDSCLVLAVEVEAPDRRRSKGLAQDAHLHPMQQMLSGRRAPCSAASARRASSWRPRPCSIDNPNPERDTTSAFSWPATSAAAPATTRSYGQCRMSADAVVETTSSGRSKPERILINRSRCNDDMRLSNGTAESVQCSSRSSARARSGTMASTR